MGTRGRGLPAEAFFPLKMYLRDEVSERKETESRLTKAIQELRREVLFADGAPSLPGGVILTPYTLSM